MVFPRPDYTMYMGPGTAGRGNKPTGTINLMSISTLHADSYEHCEFCGELIPIRAIICLGCGPIYAKSKNQAMADPNQYTGVRGSASLQDLIGDITKGDNGRQ